jgi:succinylglutamate desuccinylase
LPRLHQTDTLPAGFTDSPARDLHRILPGPTLIHLPGRRPETLLVSVLLHGNEITGLLAIQNLLLRYLDRPLPRAMSVFVGNVEAARAGMRRLDGQPDYNRTWPGTALPPSPEAELMQTVWETMRERPLFASIDVHNNTGLNPHYACVNVLDDACLQLAALFSRTAVFFETPRGTQSAAMARLCPAVTLECGKPGEPHGVDHATEFIDACLHLAEIPQHGVCDSDLHLFHTVAQVRIPDSVNFGFGRNDVQLDLLPDLEKMNFREMPAGTILGFYPGGTSPRLLVTDDQGGDATNAFFSFDGGCIRLKRSVMPSMLTLDETVIRQDCLCYLMERLPLPKGD